MLLQIRAGGAPDWGCCYKEARAAGVASRASHASAMLNAQERAHVAQVWDLIAGHEAPFGAELLLRCVGAGSPGSQRGGDRGVGPQSLGGRLDWGFQGSGLLQALEVPTRPPSPLTCCCRLFTVYPSTKIYFKHLGACPDEVNLLSHGKRVLEAVGVAVQHMDNLRWALSPLADLHAHVLRVDPANFPVRQTRPPAPGAFVRTAWGRDVVLGVPGGSGGGRHPFSCPFSLSC